METPKLHPDNGLAINWITKKRVQAASQDTRDFVAVKEIDMAYYPSQKNITDVIYQAVPFDEEKIMMLTFRLQELAEECVEVPGRQVT